MTSNGGKSNRYARIVIAALATLLASCSSCSGDNAAGDGGSDTDTDTDWEFGETTPCVNEARPTEACVPGGNYLMGCVPGDTECEDNEKPLVMVTLSPFFADKNEATIAEGIEWLNYIVATEGEVPSGLFLPRWGDVSAILKLEDGTYIFNGEAVEDCSPIMGGPEAAAGGFSWLGAKMYCEWKGMQLPTEAQWEAAARGQTFNEFPCGSNLPECWYGIYGCCYGGGACYSYYDYECSCCAPLPATEADDCLSPFGLTGMYGNALERVADYIDGDHSWCTEGCVDPQPDEARANEWKTHVAKGGAIQWSDQKGLRISSRSGDNQYVDDVNNIAGVRCVRPDEPFVVPDAGTDGGSMADSGK